MAGNVAATAPTNAQLRAALFSVSPPKRLEVAPQNFDVTTAQQVLTFNLPKAGIGLRARLWVNGTLKRTDGASVGTATASPFGPFNAVNVNFKDFTGLTRVSAGGYSLYQRQLCSNYYQGALAEEANLTTPPWSKAAGYQQPYSSTFDTFSIPAGVVSATESVPFAFELDIPIALHRNTTVGTYPFTVPSGESNIEITVSPASGTNTTAPVVVSGGTTIEILGQIGLTYYYIDPPNSQPLPTADFAVVHELKEVIVTSGLAASGSPQYTLETGRKYYALYANLVDNALEPNTVDVEKFKFLVNQANPQDDIYLNSYLANVREQFGRDMPVGTFVWWFAAFPWIPANYGSLVAQLDLAAGFTGGSNAQLRILKESTYTTSPTGA